MKSWVLLVAAVAGGVGGFLIGKIRSSGDEPLGAVPESGGEEVVVIDGDGIGASAGPVRKSTRVGGMNRAVFRRELETIKRDSNPVNRFASLSKLLSNLSAEEFEDVRSAFQGIPMRYEHRQEYQMLVYAWAGVDPEAALQFVDANANSRSIKKDDLLNPLISSWASQDPDAALAYLTELPEHKRTDQLMEGLMEGWAVKDPYAAAEYLQENLEPGKERERLAGEIASHLFKQDPKEAAEWAESHSDPAFRAEAFQELSEDWASVDPVGLSKWLGQHADEDYSAEAFQDLAREWVSEDPEAATAYFEGLPDGVSKESGIYEMAVTWGKDDLGALGQWLNELPDSSVTDLGVKAYVNRLAEESPQAAIDSALSITGDEVRSETVLDLGQRWYGQDPQAAAEWATANEIPIEAFQRKDETVKMVIQGEEIEIPKAVIEGGTAPPPPAAVEPVQQLLQGNGDSLDIEMGIERLEP